MRNKWPYSSQAGWIEAGLTDARNEKLERPIALRYWRAPLNIELDGDRLVWGYSRPNQGEQIIQAGPQMLYKFVNLYDAQAENIQDYARRWGLLWICKHNLPTTHNPPPAEFTTLWAVPLTPAKNGETYCVPISGVLGKGWEPLSPWRELSKYLRAILNIAAQIHLNQAGKDEDWLIVIRWHRIHSVWKDDAGRTHGRNIFFDGVETPLDPIISPYSNKPKPSKKEIQEHRIEEAHKYIIACIRRLLHMANIHVDWFWPKGTDPQIQITGGDLFGALVMQLVLAINQADGLAVCSACGEFYAPKRRPRPDQKNYCPEKACRKLTAWRKASARYYQNKTAKKHKKG